MVPKNSIMCGTKDDTRRFPRNPHTCRRCLSEVTVGVSWLVLERLSRFRDGTGPRALPHLQEFTIVNSCAGGMTAAALHQPASLVSSCDAPPLRRRPRRRSLTLVLPTGAIRR